MIFSQGQAEIKVRVQRLIAGESVSSISISYWDTEGGVSLSNTMLFMLPSVIKATLHGITGGHFTDRVEHPMDTDLGSENSSRRDY